MPEPRLIKADGETLSIRGWAAKTGMCAETITLRLRRGWSPEDAVTMPPATRHPRTEEDRIDLINDILDGTASSRTLAERHKVSARTIHRVRARLRAQGYTVRVPEGGSH